MTTLPIIKQIKSFKDMGIFRDQSQSSDIPFRKLNLIYGFNGSGKTTLSRAFQSLADGSYHESLPDGSKFTIELDDGSKIKSDENIDQLKKRLLVFNTDFVEKNLKWKEGKASPVTYFISEDQSNIATEVEEKEKTYKAQDLTLSIEETALKAKSKALKDWKTATAKQVETAIGESRTYTSRELGNDFKKKTYEGYSLLSDDELSNCTKQIRQDAPPKKHDLLDGRKFELEQFFLKFARLCQTTFADITIKELQENPSMLSWVSKGYDYHVSSSLNNCLFCGNEISPTRLNLLNDALNTGFNDFQKRIEQFAKDFIECKKRFEDFQRDLPQDHEINLNCIDKYKAERSKLLEGMDALLSVVSKGEEICKLKQINPNNKIELTASFTETEIRAFIKRVIDDIEQINKTIRIHNQLHDDFQKSKEAAKNKIKAHHLLSVLADHQKLIDEEAAQKKKHGDLEAEQEKLDKEIEDLHAQLRQHGGAVDPINKLLSAYLGHNELQIGLLDEGYQILRHEHPVTGPLSEGEKTALALCYFLSKLKEEDRNIKETIVVIDDPISSLDTKALNYAYNLLRSQVKDAQQVIFLTHNLQFMNEVKKWIKTGNKDKSTDDKPAKAALFFIETKGAAQRSSKLVELPKLLRNNDSEYQYLFHLVLHFSNSDDGIENQFFYLLPNIMRKLLELFFAFKFPKTNGLDNILQSDDFKSLNLDETQYKAINRLSQVESHSDNLDDFISFSPMTVEETKQAANSILLLVSKMDPTHYTQMESLSS